MKPPSDSTSVLLELESISGYAQRLSFIERNLHRIDASFVKVLDESVDICPPLSKLQQATYRATILAEIAFVHGRVGNITTAREFATHCLMAHQKGLYLGGQIGVDCTKETKRLLEILLEDAGEFRAFGLEQEAWQAYWIADPIHAAMDTYGESVTTGQLLSAAVVLEQVGMVESAENARREAETRIADGAVFLKEKTMAQKIVGPPPTALPPPDSYDGRTMESALRFRSQTVAVRCVQQTRCPTCRGPMHYGGSSTLLHKEGYYRLCNLTCQRDSKHDALTLFRNSLLLPNTQIFAGVGSKLDREQEERLQQLQAGLPNSKPRWPSARVVFVLTCFFLLVAVVSILPPVLVSYLVFRWSGLPSPFVLTLIGCTTGLVIFRLLLLVRALSRSAGHRSSLRPVLFVLLALTAGGAGAFLIGGWAGITAMPLAALAFKVVRKRVNNSVARQGIRGRSKR